MGLFMIHNYRVRRFALTCFVLTLASGMAAAEDTATNDLVLRNGTIYDGSGKAPYRGDVAIKADRITYVGPHRALAGRTEIDVNGQAIAPGFINMLAHPEESLFAAASTPRICAARVTGSNRQSRKPSISPRRAALRPRSTISSSPAATIGASSITWSP
jgi:hypothetical protein